MFKTHTIYTIDPIDYLDKIFTVLPSNAFINKGRCGIGGTTLEINNKNRCSIIVSPTVGILIDKKKSHPDLFIVWAKVTLEEVKAELALKKPGQKFMTTAEGSRKVIEAAVELGMLEELYYKWFFLLDECHSYITEDYRKGILRPFDYFWQFKSKSIISATPYFFSDERFWQLDYHEVRFTREIGTVTLVDCVSVPATLKDLIIQAQTQKGRLHIFLNSVTEIVLTAKRLGLIDFNIYCANDKDGVNLRKLGDLKSHYKEQPDTNNFAKVNFYTSRYFEGWDLKDDEDAVMVLVSDIHCLHSKVSVGMKLKQAAGRIRIPNPQIIHLTNHHRNYQPSKSLKTLEEEYYAEATFKLKQHQDYLEYKRERNEQPTKNPDIENYADVAYKTQEATLNKLKLDQLINHAHSHEVYNNILLIEEEWVKGYFKVNVVTSKIQLETTTSMKRKSKAQQLKEDYLAIKASKQEKSFYFGETVEDRIKVTNPLAYKAALLLDESVMDSLKYNPKQVNIEVIRASNVSQEKKLMQLLADEFKQGTRDTVDNIKTRLQRIYNLLDLRNPRTGKCLIAYATDLDTNGWFDIHPSKEDTGKDRLENGFIIMRARFSVRVAA